MFKVVSLFSGCGGFDLGFKNAVFKIVWANDFFKEAIETYKLNIDDNIIYGDITKIPSSEITDDVDVLIGGFPCQEFSIANKKRNMKDSRNYLYKELIRILKDKKPKIFVAENVKGLVSMDNGKVLDMIIKDFEEVGYKVDYKILKASDYGVPQNIERVFIIGNNINIENKFPIQTHFSNTTCGLNEKHISAKEAIGYLSDVRIRDNSFLLNGEFVHNHIASTNVADKFYGRLHDVNQLEVCEYLKYWRNKSGISIKKIDEHFGYSHTAGHWFRKDNNSGSIPNPKDWWELKKLLKFDNVFDIAVTEYSLKEIKYEQSLRISNWDNSSDTITATCPEIHPNKDRRLSVRECAILQTFPNDFVFKGSLGNMYKQIGNAVPVLLAEKIADVLYDSLKKYSIVGN